MNQTRENLLNLSLSVPEADRQKAPDLEIGYDPRSDSWELIIKYNGGIKKYESSGIKIEELINGYAIALVKREELDQFLNHKEIEYAEKPKQFYFI